MSDPPSAEGAAQEIETDRSPPADSTEVGTSGASRSDRPVVVASVESPPSSVVACTERS